MTFLMTEQVSGCRGCVRAVRARLCKRVMRGGTASTVLEQGLMCISIGTWSYFFSMILFETEKEKIQTHLGSIHHGPIVWAIAHCP